MLTQGTSIQTATGLHDKSHGPMRPWIACFTLLAMLSCGATTALGQGNILTPLDEVIPLADLGTPTNDLIRLSTSYADAIRDLKVAQLSINTVQKLRPNAIVTNLEVQIANLNLEAAQRKVRILRAIVEKQLKAAEDKLEIIKYLESLDEQGNAGNGNGDVRPMQSYIRVQDESTVQILKMILSMQ